MEQSYKEKYEQALSKAKDMLNYKEVRREDMEYLFPELAESEDEKMMKEIINYFQCQSEEEPTRKEIHNKWIAWLENIPVTIDHEKREGFHLGYKACHEEQGEQKFEMKTAEESLGVDSETYNKIVDECIFGEQKTKENKGNIGGISPTWSEEDEQYVEDTLALIGFGFSAHTIGEVQEWLHSLQDRVQPQHKQEWKQENTGDLTAFENAMMHIGGSFFGQHAGLDPNDTNSIKEQANLLLELVPSKEWSEEDKQHIRTIIHAIHGAGNITPIDGELAEDWLKSLKGRLKPQNRWKPSELQLGCLSDAIEHYNSLGYPAPKLKELYEQLKKL